MFSDHYRRLEEALSNKYNLFNLDGWIKEHTYLEGKRFNFKHHEYQVDIITDDSPTLLVNKAAQTGLSEIFARWALAIAATQNNFTVIWTFPSSSDAERFAKARLDPTIAQSPELSRIISKAVNSTELKQFGDNTFVYIRGTISDTAGLSVPADVLIHDELDRSDIANVSAYVSRLQHKTTKVRRLFSTPTVTGYGIDLECRTARRKRQVWCCSHCNHKFLPSYEEDVHIPGWDKPKKEINRANIKDIRWRDAVLLCPNCKRIPSTDVRYREWVVENTADQYDTVAYYVSPFCAPAIISPSYLVQASTTFNKWSEFVNQALGLCAEDAQESLCLADIVGANVSGDFRSSGDLHVMGVDMGIMCHIVIAREHQGTFVTVHKEKVHYTELEERRRKLCSEWRVVTSVHDTFPYVDLITRITNYDPNAFGAVYVTRASSETHTVKLKEADVQEGRLNIRAVHVNRDVVFDAIMWGIKQGDIKFGNLDEEFTLQLLDMKRVQKFDKHGGIVYKWEKTQGLDHWHHALLYAFMAAKLRSTASWVTPGVVPLVTSFRLPKSALGGSGSVLAS